MSLLNNLERPAKIASNVLNLNLLANSWLPSLENWTSPLENLETSMFTDNFSFTFKMEVADFSDTLLSSYLSPRLHVREDSNLGEIFVLLHICINHVSVHSANAYRKLCEPNTYVFHVTKFISGIYSETSVRAFNENCHTNPVIHSQINWNLPQGRTETVFRKTTDSFISYMLCPHLPSTIHCIQIILSTFSF